MRYIFKTSYDQDINIARHEGDLFWYGLLLVATLATPFVMGEFYLGELSYVLILAIAGVGIMLLTGYTGLVSLGHAAFLGIGAYAESWLLKAGVPMGLSVPLAGLMAGLMGILVGLPALRMSGIYLAIATLMFGGIVQHVFAKWESVTGGFKGASVPMPSIFGVPITEPWLFYYICLAVTIAGFLVAINLLRAPTGRALIAVRDSEIAARSMGVNLALYKTFAFGLSAAFAGIAGALFAHKLGYLAPDAFDIQLSIQLLLMAVIGGLGSLHGVIFGAIFVGFLPQAIALLRTHLPDAIAYAPGIEPGVFGLILVLVILFEPQGIYGRWLKLKLYFDLAPLYKNATFKRQKSFAKSERLR